MSTKEFTNVVNVSAEKQTSDEIETVVKLRSECGNSRSKLQVALTKVRATKWVKAFEKIKREAGPELVQWEEIIEDKGFKFDRTKQIGSGRFSNVYPAKANGKEYAVKIIQYRTMALELGIKDWERHAKILVNLKHPKLNNIVKAYIVANTYKLYLYLQFAAKGSVQKLVDNSKKAVQIDLAKMWIRDVLEALIYLHSQGLAHRKVHANKVLLADIKTNAKLALPDSYAEAFNPADPGSPRPYKVTYKFTENPCTAYEGLFSSSSGYDPIPADIWSAGCVLYFMLVCKYPFSTKSKSKIKEEIEAKKWSYAGLADKGPKLDDDSKSFLSEIFTKDAAKRPTAAELLCHRYLQI